MRRSDVSSSALSPVRTFSSLNIDDRNDGNCRRLLITEFLEGSEAGGAAACSEYGGLFDVAVRGGVVCTANLGAATGLSKVMRVGIVTKARFPPQ